MKLIYTVSQKVDHQLMAATLSKPSQFTKFFHPHKYIVNKSHIIYPISPKVCCCTTCGKLKFKFAPGCASGGCLVDLLWCLSASESLASQTSSLSIRGWRSTVVIAMTCFCTAAVAHDAWRVRQFVHLWTRQRTCALGTRHCAVSWAVNSGFHSSRFVTAEKHRL